MTDQEILINISICMARTVEGMEGLTRSLAANYPQVNIWAGDHSRVKMACENLRRRADVDWNVISWYLSPEDFVCGWCQEWRLNPDKTSDILKLFFKKD